MTVALCSIFQHGPNYSTYIRFKNTHFFDNKQQNTAVYKQKRCSPCLKHALCVWDISQATLKPYSNTAFPKQMTLLSSRVWWVSWRPWDASVRLTSTHPATGSARISPSRGTRPCRGGASGPRPIGRGWGGDQNKPHILPCGCLGSSVWSPGEQRHTHYYLSEWYIV